MCAKLVHFAHRLTLWSILLASGPALGSNYIVCRQIITFAQT